MASNTDQFNRFINVPVQTEEVGLMHPPPKPTQREASSSSDEQKADNDIESKDLVSLPNDMVEEIFSLIEIRQLVQCGIVAKPFRYCFKYGKKLDFDLSFRQALRDHTHEYQLIVCRIMDQHVGPIIQSLKLSFTPVNNLDNQVMVAHWINKAAEKGVEELELKFYRGLDSFRVTYDVLFKIKTLKVLRLLSVNLGSPPKDFHVIGLRLLKVCSLNHLSVKEVILDALLKNCTELQILEIIECFTSRHIIFSAGNLKKLIKFRLDGCILLRAITLDAPSLTTLHYSGHLISFNFLNCGNIVDFMLNLLPIRWSNFSDNYFLLDKLMLTLPEIEVMTTTTELLEVLCYKFLESGMMDRFYSIPTVTEINVTLKGSMRCNLFTIAYFLSKFPCCERLFIDVRGWLPDIEPTPFQLVQQPPPVQWTEEQTALGNRALAPNYPHLELLKVTGFQFEANEMELLRYFLSTGHNLKTVAIFLASPGRWTPIPPDEVVFNYDLRPVITSPDLWVNIYQHDQENDLYPAKHPKKWYKVDL